MPLGVAAAHRPWLYAFMRPLLDLMQTLPTFVYLIPTLVLFHLGSAPGLISTVIFAIAAPIRLTHLGIASVPLPLKEAGEAFGATKRQLLWKVELPYAMPTIMAGVTQCIMLSLSMVVIAALVGAAGLGTPVVRALGTVNIPMGIEAGVSIVLLAIVLDRVFRNPERKAERLNVGRCFRSRRHRFRRPAGRGARADRQGRDPRRDPQGDRGRSRRGGRRSRGRARRDLRADGPVGLGQVDDPARGQRAEQGRARQGAGPTWRRARSTSPVAARTELRMLRTSRIAMVFQQFALLPWRTVAENVAFGLELRGLPKAEIDRIVAEKLAMVGLTQWAGKFGHELSGGMQQRVGLARAFATDADILLMDEPFSALDPLIRDKLQDELLLLQKDLKKTIIFVSHDLDEALKIGNRIAILEGGRIVQCGAAEDILLRPADAYVAEFVKHMNPLNVLRGGCADDAGGGARCANDDEVHLDRGGRIRLRLDAEGRPIGVTLDGAAGTLAKADGATGETSDDAGGFDVVVAPIDLKMRSAIALRSVLRQSDRPRRPARPHGRALRRRRDLPRAAAAAAGGCERLAQFASLFARRSQPAAFGKV